MDQETQKKEGLAIPIAIIIAGLLIGGGLYFSTGNSGGNSNVQVKNTDITILPVTEKDHILGNPDADIILVEFSDLECPFCKNFHQTMNTVVSELGKNGKIAWVYRHFPLINLHPKAPKEAEASECAAKLGGNNMFWTYVNKIFSITPSNNGLDPAELPKVAGELGLDVAKFNECLSSGEMKETVDKQFADAVASGGTGTPYTVMLFKNGPSFAQKKILEAVTVKSQGAIRLVGDKVTLGGALQYETMKGLLEELLK